MFMFSWLSIITITVTPLATVNRTLAGMPLQAQQRPAYPSAVFSPPTCGGLGPVSLGIERLVRTLILSSGVISSDRNS